jgi:cell division protease FtsH
MTPRFRTNVVIAAVLVVVLAVVAQITRTQRAEAPAIPYSQFLSDVRSGQIASVVVLDPGPGPASTTGRLKSGSPFHTVLPHDYRDVLSAMQTQLVKVEIQDAGTTTRRMLQNSAPFFALLAIWIILVSRKFRWPNA